MSGEQVMTLESLPPDAREAVFTKSVQGKKRLSQWLVLLNVLARFDTITDQAYRGASGRAIKSLVICMASLFLSFFALAATDGSMIVLYVGACVGVPALICAIVFGVKASSLKNVDLDNDFKETLLPVLSALSEDIAPKGRISLNLNMDNPSHGKYKISEEKLPPGKNRKLIETVYELHCCNAVIPLDNGMVLTLDIVKRPASYDRYYSNPRGKFKHKQKWKMVTTVTAALAPADSTLAVSESGVSELAGSGKVKLADKKGGQLCRLTRKFKYKSPDGVPEECVSPDAVIEMFMKLCSTLNPA